MDPATVKAFVQGLHDIQVTRYTQLASSVIIIFDHKKHMDVGQDSIFAGIGFFRWQGWTGLIGCLLAEALAELTGKRLFDLPLTLPISTDMLIAVAILIPDGLFCVPNNVTSHFYAFWIPMLAFEFLLCLLALIRGFQTYRSNGSLFRSGRRLVGILVRDSLMYFVVICATYLTCLLIWITASVNFLGVPIGFALAMSCVLANRVVLNVRAVNRDLNASRIPTSDTRITDVKDATSFSSPGALTSFEMGELRTMRADRNLCEIIEMYEPDDLPFVVLQTVITGLYYYWLFVFHL
ncbi:hypothetical protein BJ912DRAFT_1020456 [Pholiota molesta]|nr:hypothetical protein BJ912DRAFT_1020456 [Pholiota molesta]